MFSHSLEHMQICLSLYVIRVDFSSIDLKSGFKIILLCTILSLFIFYLLQYFFLMDFIVYESIPPSAAVTWTTVFFFLMSRINTEVFCSSVYRFQYYQSVAVYVYMKDACRQIANCAIYPVYLYEEWTIAGVSQADNHWQSPIAITFRLSFNNYCERFVCFFIVI